MVFALYSCIGYVFLEEVIVPNKSIYLLIAFNIGLNQGTSYKAGLKHGIDLRVLNRVSNF